MKPRNRDINIFNLSMLDVISGALGAFLIIMIVLFPYYKKESIDYRQELAEMQRQVQSMEQQINQAQEQAQQAQAAAERAQQQLQAAQEVNQEMQEQLQAARSAQSEATRAQQQLQQARTQAEEMRRQLGEARRQLAKTFLVVYIRWATSEQDIDLHVVDPSGAEFSFSKKTISGRPGELSEDSTVGPGNEVWEIFNAPPGTYKIYASLYDPKGNSKKPVIKGRVIHRDGSQRLNSIRLDRKGDKKLMATVTINSDGDVQIR